MSEGDSKRVSEPVRLPNHPCAEFCNCRKRTKTGYAATTLMHQFDVELKAGRAGRIEQRGRPNAQDSEALIDIFIEIEARRRAAGTTVKQFLDDPRMRYVAEDRNRVVKQHHYSRPKVAKVGRWPGSERARVRKAHIEGKREACWYCCTTTNGQPLYRWNEFMRRIEARQAQLVAGPAADVFVLTVP